MIVPSPLPARRLRVLVASQPTSGGVARCVQELVAAGLDRGHDVVLACPTDAGGLAAWAAHAGVKHLELFDANRLPTPRDGRDLRRLRRVAAGADVLHLHSSKAGLLGRLAARSLPTRRRPRVLFTPHAWSWLADERTAPLLRTLERRLGRWCDAIVAVSHEEAAAGTAVLGSRAPICTIPNGVDRERFQPGAGSAAHRDAAPLLVCVGRLTHQKGQDIAVRALAEPELHHAQLRLVGSGPDRAALDDLAEELGVADRVSFTGEVPEVVPHYQAADVVVAPSRWEGLSLAWLEALACGAPMVVTDVAGAEAVRGAGVVLPRPDPVVLAHEVATVLGDPGLRRELAEAARQRSARYDLAASLAANLALWEGDLPGRPGHQDLGASTD